MERKPETRGGRADKVYRFFTIAALSVGGLIANTASNSERQTRAPRSSDNSCPQAYSECLLDGKRFLIPCTETEKDPKTGEVRFVDYTSFCGGCIAVGPDGSTVVTITKP